MKTKDEGIEFFAKQGHDFVSHLLDTPGTPTLTIEHFDSDMARVVEYYSPQYEITADEAEKAYTGGALDEAFTRLAPTKR